MMPHHMFAVRNIQMTRLSQMAPSRGFFGGRKETKEEVKHEPKDVSASGHLLSMKTVRIRDPVEFLSDF